MSATISSSLLSVQSHLLRFFNERSLSVLRGATVLPLNLECSSHRGAPTVSRHGRVFGTIWLLRGCSPSLSTSSSCCDQDGVLDGRPATAPTDQCRCRTWTPGSGGRRVPSDLSTIHRPPDGYFGLRAEQGDKVYLQQTKFRMLPATPGSSAPPHPRQTPAVELSAATRASPGVPAATAARAG